MGDGADEVAATRAAAEVTVGVGVVRASFWMAARMRMAIRMVVPAAAARNGLRDADRVDGRAGGDLMAGGRLGDGRLAAGLGEEGGGVAVAGVLAGEFLEIADGGGGGLAEQGALGLGVEAVVAALALVRGGDGAGVGELAPEDRRVGVVGSFAVEVGQGALCGVQGVGAQVGAGLIEEGGDAAVAGGGFVGGAGGAGAGEEVGGVLVAGGDASEVEQGAFGGVPVALAEVGTGLVVEGGGVGRRRGGGGGRRGDGRRGSLPPVGGDAGGAGGGAEPVGVGEGRVELADTLEEVEHAVPVADTVMVAGLRVEAIGPEAAADGGEVGGGIAEAGGLVDDGGEERGGPRPVAAPDGGEGALVARGQVALARVGGGRNGGRGQGDGRRVVGQGRTRRGGGIEGAGEVAGGGEAGGGVLGEGAVEGGLEDRQRGVVAPRGEIGRGQGEVALDDLVQGAAVGGRAGEQLAEDAAEGVDVGGAGDAAVELLGGHVGDGADDERGLGAGALQEAGDAEVGEEQALAVGGEEHVLGLDVAVDEAAGVGVVERGGGLAHVGQGAADGERPGAEGVGEGAAGDVGHDEVGGAVWPRRSRGRRGCWGGRGRRRWRPRARSGRGSRGGRRRRAGRGRGP